MKTTNRDLLVLVKDERLNEEAIEFELEQLNRLLMVLETIDNLSLAHEVFDMNRYRVLNRQKAISEVISKKDLKPFVFIFNKN